MRLSVCEACIEAWKGRLRHCSARRGDAQSGEEKTRKDNITQMQTQYKVRIHNNDNDDKNNNNDNTNNLGGKILLESNNITCWSYFCSLRK